MKETEVLLARVMNFLAEKYKNRLVLKGGMLLRLLDSPRATQDLDYAWIRTKKRNLFAGELRSALETLEGIQVVDVASNSRGIFLEITDRARASRVKLEINVIKSFHCPPRPMTTAALSHPHNLRPQVIATMDLSEALSHKIAAALERDLTRDLYDLMILGRLTSPDEGTLRERLSQLEVRRAKPRSVTPKEAAVMLGKKIDSLTPKSLQSELASVLEGEPLEGMDRLLKSAVSRIIEKLERL
ncbi:MAG: nucleotidyl transferase AbiEii/AbiGii toxin family protein [Deltaproteobacteria bacterium]|nr:nucleotidyl transferase AbiEii/AbiGii toxin family protein [Deltaproteobacteria bacterium]